jgi:chromosome segregation ATPase
VTAIRNFQSEIQEHRQRQADADDGQHAQKVSELEEAKVECDRAKQDLTDHRAGLQSLNDELQQVQKQLGPVSEKEREKKSDVLRSEKQIKDLGQGQRNWMEAYPKSSNLQTLLKLIEQDRRFRDRPVGPMGRHVKLLKPEWSSILEKSFGASLNAFVVTSRADQSVLTDLMKRTNWSVHELVNTENSEYAKFDSDQYPIFIGQSSRIDTSGHEPDAQLDTWLRVLKVWSELNILRDSADNMNRLMLK